MKILGNIKNSIKRYLVVLHQWSLGHPAITRAIHTFWQVALGYILTHLTAIHSPADVQVVLTGAYGSALSAVKSYVWPIIIGWAVQNEPHIADTPDQTTS